MAVCICNSVHLCLRLLVCCFGLFFFYPSLLQGCKQDSDSVPTPFKGKIIKSN